MIWIAHRGASHDAPENTLRAIREAWTQRADAIECDIHRSADGHLVLSHDATTARTGGEPLVIAAQPLHRLRQLDMGLWKGEAFRGERMPTLPEALRTVPTGRGIYIEVKCGPEAARQLALQVRRHLNRIRISVIGFDLATMAACKQQLPMVPHFWLRGPERAEDGTIRHMANEWIARCRDHSLDGLDLHFSAIDARTVDAVRAAGMGLVAWTVNDPAEARRLLQLGVDGITTDRPGWLREQCTR